MNIQELIVVEGKEDTRRLKEIFPNIETIETRGSAINQRTLDLIKEAKTKRGIIIFTDPDYQGQRIRSIINEYVPGCMNAYIQKEKAICTRKNKVGVEHCSTEDIIDALKNITPIQPIKGDLTIMDLYEMKIIGHQQSNELRDYLSVKLNLGYNNAKQFLKKVQIFNISKDVLKSLIMEYERKCDQ